MLYVRCLSIETFFAGKNLKQNVHFLFFVLADVTMCARVIVVYTGNLSPIRNESHSWAIFGGKTREHLSLESHTFWVAGQGRLGG